jgi:hypothetical protein
VTSWFEAHDKLAGWAQFFGAMLALVVTYFTAFAPSWRRKRQLQAVRPALLRMAMKHWRATIAPPQTSCLSQSPFALLH